MPHSVEIGVEMIPLRLPGVANSQSSLMTVGKGSPILMLLVPGTGITVVRHDIGGISSCGESEMVNKLRALRRVL